MSEFTEEVIIDSLRRQLKTAMELAESATENVLELDQQIKAYKAKLGLISIAADEGNLAKVKELIPPSCADVVREMRAEAVETVANDHRLRVLDGPDIYSDGLIEYANQLRNPEQEKV